MCEVDCGENRQETTSSVRGRGKKARETKKQKMGEEYKQKGGKSTKRLHSTEMTKQTKV